MVYLSSLSRLMYSIRLQKVLCPGWNELSRKSGLSFLSKFHVRQHVGSHVREVQSAVYMVQGQTCDEKHEHALDNVKKYQRIGVYPYMDFIPYFQIQTSKILH